MTENMLDGLGVLVTRPRQQAAELVDAIEARGGNAILFPSLEIVGRDRADIEADLAGLSQPDITIFVSRNAVTHGFEHAAGTLAAIGPATAAEIEAAGGSVEIYPRSGFDSEHLLAEQALQDMNGKTIRIIRGNDGREHLAESLRGRGGRVEYLATYERRQPLYTAGQLDELENRWRAGEVGAIVVMSVQSLVNLRSLLPDWCARHLRETLLVTPAARVLKEALMHNPDHSATLAAGPQANEIVDAIVAAIGRSQAAQP